MIKCTILLDGCHVPDDWNILFVTEFVNLAGHEALRVWVEMPYSDAIPEPDCEGCRHEGDGAYKSPCLYCSRVRRTDKWEEEK